MEYWSDEYRNAPLIQHSITPIARALFCHSINKEVQPCFAFIAAAPITAAASTSHATIAAAMLTALGITNPAPIVAAKITPPASTSRACIAAATITTRMRTALSAEGMALGA